MRDTIGFEPEAFFYAALEGKNNSRRCLYVLLQILLSLDHHGKNTTR